jgi:hypothetical protein
MGDVKPFFECNGEVFQFGDVWENDSGERYQVVGLLLRRYAPQLEWRLIGTDEERFADSFRGPSEARITLRPVSVSAGVVPPAEDVVVLWHPGLTGWKLVSRPEVSHG